MRRTLAFVTIMCILLAGAVVVLLLLHFNTDRRSFQERFFGNGAGYQLFVIHINPSAK